MYDQPTASDLLEAATQHFEQHIVPLAKATDRKLYFQTLVAVNVLKIVRRELAHQNSYSRAQWSQLNDILGEQALPPDADHLYLALEERTAHLCTLIRQGKFDDDETVFKFLMNSTIGQLDVANPKYLAMLQAEDDSSD